jgi:hypothetical protein
MQANWNKLVSHMSSNGSDEKFLPACTGEETDEELRALIIHLTANCSVSLSRDACVFRPLTGLTYASLHNVVNGLSRETCLQMLAEECACRNRGDSHHCQVP